MTDNEKLAELIFNNIDKTAEYYEEIYPKRDLSSGAVVTRFAPSPTGFLHIGGLFTSMISQRVAKKSDGVFYLRIEDTDKKREVENGVTEIVKGLNAYGIEIDEGMISENESIGKYGPYTQSERKDIYQAFVKELLKKGLAYPCFCSAEELAQTREKQEEQKLNSGYYGEFAKCRDLSYEEVEKNIANGMSYVIRLRSNGDIENRITFEDGIKGEISMPENNQDVVILKSDGIPTYHFAHVIDDHLMRTTHVIRGDEWISSVPIHYQLFEVLGFKMPQYVHISPIRKEDNGGKRKISKRKDPEAAVTYYHEQGYPKDVVLEYLMTLANSNYEEWRNENPTLSRDEFDFSFEKMSQSGALFDLVKLTDISKNYISTYNKQQVYDMVAAWSKEYNEKLYNILTDNKEYAINIFSIERGNEKPRKDIAKWSDVENYITYFYDEFWDKEYDWPENLSNDDMIEILETYKQTYDENDVQENWFPKVRDMSEQLGYAKAPKFYKKNPDDFKGHVGDVSSVIRVAATGRKNTPDLYCILQILGKDKVISRFDNAIKILKGN